LAIMWTIAFISFQWYNTQARDSLRISDLNIIKSWLELFQIESWNYPIPTNWENITYSWATLWTQGLFWESVYSNIDKLDKIPTDPLTNKEYTYSVTDKRNEYELWGIVEEYVVAINPSQPSLILGKEQLQVQAWEALATAVVMWNYNWMILKSLSWTTCDILANPSIIATNTDTSTDILNILNNQNLVYNWYKNLPSSYIGSQFKQDWWFDFITNKFIVYTDTWSCEPLTDKSSYTARLELIEWLKDAYSWTILEPVWEIQNIVDLEINTIAPSKEFVNYAANFANNNLWWKIPVDSLSNNWELNTTYQCDWLFWDAYNDDIDSANYSVDYLDFDLCSNTIILNSFSNIPTSTNLTSNTWARDVYAFILEAWTTYNFETLGHDSNSDTDIYLYDNQWNKLLMNDDINLSIFRSKIEYTALYSWYYFLWVMWDYDDWIYSDYTLNIN
jgi:hypothetical protein